MKKKCEHDWVSRDIIGTHGRTIGYVYKCSKCDEIGFDSKSSVILPEKKIK